MKAISKITLPAKLPPDKLPTTNTTNKLNDAIRALLPSSESGQIEEDAYPQGAVFLIKLFSNASGGGKYYYKVFEPPTSDISASGTLMEADFGTTPGIEGLALNAAEIGRTTHDINTALADRVYLAIFLRYNTDGTPVVGFHGMQWEDCTVPYP